ncbi:MAG: hypothetical protein QNJ29_11110 [Rhizobiaceae bacterium]|nr:hypothetical protein [Rhizobiaceae bacterium]
MLKHSTRREFLTNSVAMGTVLGLGGVAISQQPQSAFAASRDFVAVPHGCAAKHAEMAGELREFGLQPNIDPSALNLAQRTSHCSDCGTMIHADLQLAA